MAPIDKKGKSKLLDVPIGRETTLQYKKALTYLHKFQCDRRPMVYTVPPNKCTQINSVLRKYESKLITDDLQTDVERAAHCVYRDSYTPGKLIEILQYLWHSNHNTSIRDRFAICVRHHMLLRAQDLENLNFSDCFSTTVSPKQHLGTQQAVTLVFYLNKGKTLGEGEIKLSCAMRHEDIERCPVSAFAFYMFSLLQVS